MGSIYKYDYRISLIFKNSRTFLDVFAYHLLWKPEFLFKLYESYTRMYFKNEATANKATILPE